MISSVTTCTERARSISFWVRFVAVNELTQENKLYTSSSFQYRAGYFVLTMLYLSMTLVLSLLLRWYRRRLGLDDD
jgi:ABC-type amino acid transport system permease subunit